MLRELILAKEIESGLIFLIFKSEFKARFRIPELILRTVPSSSVVTTAFDVESGTESTSLTTGHFNLSL